MYEWLKAFHIIAVISWMAGLLYLPRLMVYHCDAEPGSRQSETFKVMERRLLRAIMTPAMAISWALGIALGIVYGGGSLDLGLWFIIKVVLVVILSAAHMLLARHVRDFARDQNVKSPRYFRIVNEVPTLLMVAIVVLVVVKPI